MEVLQIHGREFVKASKAARDLGYAADYIGQLCRSGAIRAERVGRGWYVDAQEIARHKQSKQRSVAAKSRASLVKRVSLVQHVHAGGVHTTRAIQPIEYTDDDTPLVPLIGKRRLIPAVIPVTPEVVKLDTDESEEVVVQDAPIDVRDESETLPADESVVYEDSARVVPIRVPSIQHDIVLHEKRDSVEVQKPIVRETFSVQRVREKEDKKPGGGVFSGLLYMFALLGIVAGLFVRVDGVITRNGVVREYRLEMVLPEGVGQLVRGE